MQPDQSLETYVRDQPSVVAEVTCGGVEEPARVTVRGDLDALNAGRLQKAVIDVLRHRRPSRLELDLRPVSFLDSAGIRALLTCKADAEQVGCPMTVTGTGATVHRVLEITGLLDHFGIADHPAPDRATGSMRSGTPPP